MTEEKMFDLAEMDTVEGSNKGFDVELFHPKTKEDLGIIIHILGRDSDKFLEVSRAQQKRRLNKMSKFGGARSPGRVVTPEEVEKDSIELLAECTTGWSDTLMVDGAKLPFSVENAKAVYRRFPWIREQVDEAMDDRANFI